MSERPKCRVCDKDATKRLKATAEATTCDEHFQVCYDAFKNCIENVRTQYQQQYQQPPTPEEEPPEETEEPSPPPQQLPNTTVEYELHKLVNTERKKIGRRELQYDDALAVIAEKHSVDMQVRNFFAHTNPSGDNSFARAKKAGYAYQAFGENIAWFSSSNLPKMSIPEIANKIMYGEKGWWLSKEGHKENLLNSMFDREGLGVHIFGNQVWATQNLAKKASSSSPSSPTTTTKPPEPETPTTTTTAAADKYGIKKLYEDNVHEPFFRIMDMDNPTKDSFLNKEERANMRKESDGSWSLDGKDTGKYQVRLGLWMNPPQTDIEGTIYAYHIEDIPGHEGESRYSYQFYRGGGDHSTSNNGCEGAAYKGRILENKDVGICKELLHADYTSTKGHLKKLTKSPFGNWIGVKLVTYNMPKLSNGRIPVMIQVWCDEEGMDQNGVLHPEKQNWQKYAEVIDKGGWSSGTGNGCPPLEIGNNTGKRKPDEIFNMPGGKPDKGNVITYRTDGAKTKIKDFSVRSIKNPSSGVV